MRSVATFSASDRHREKELARQDDLARIAQGIETAGQVRDRNGLFSALDAARARFVGRRRIRLED